MKLQAKVSSVVTNIVKYRESYQPSIS